MEPMKLLAALAARRPRTPELDLLRARLSPDEFEAVIAQANSHITMALQPDNVDLRLAGMALLAAAAMYSTAIKDFNEILGGDQAKTRN